MASCWNEIIEPELEEFDVSSLIKIRNKRVVGEMEIFVIEDFEKYGPYEVHPQMVCEVTLRLPSAFIEVRCKGGQIIRVKEKNDQGEVKVVYRRYRLRRSALDGLLLGHKSFLAQ